MTLQGSNAHDDSRRSSVHSTRQQSLVVSGDKSDNESQESGDESIPESGRMSEKSLSQSDKKDYTQDFEDNEIDEEAEPADEIDGEELAEDVSDEDGVKELE